MNPASLSPVAGRPMLSRVADSMYWMARYVERAEHVARVLHVTDMLLADVGDFDAAARRHQWSGVLRTFHLDAADAPASGDGDAIVRRLTFDAGEVTSIRSCIRMARENARAIRDNLSSEIYEELNALFWQLGDERTHIDFVDSPARFYDRVTSFGLLFQGLCDQTLARDQRWHFAQAGKWLERIDVTCRLLEVRLGDVPADGADASRSPVQALETMAALRMSGGLEAFRRRNPATLGPRRVAEFVILAGDFPRGISFATEAALASVIAIRTATGHGGRGEAADAERHLGRLAGHLRYSRIEDLMEKSLTGELAKIRQTARVAAKCITRAYFPA